MKTETSFHAAAGWSHIPNDLLILILLYFLPLKDAIRCGAVCKEWHSVFSDAREKLRRRPWLMIRKKQIVRRKKKGRTDTLLFRFRFQFLSLRLRDDGRVYKIDDGRVYEILPTNDVLLGSSQGWLIMASKQIQAPPKAPPKIHMVDVHTGDLYNLPPLSDEIRRYIPTAVDDISSPTAVVVPSSSGRYAVACTIKGRLMVGQVGEEQWIILEKPPHMSSLHLEDLNYHEGLLYSVCSKGNILVWNLSEMSTSNSPKVLPGPSMGKKVSSRKLYIVPASPYGLLFIARYPYKVEVFALDSKTGEWMQVSCMGKCSLFVGCNQSMCLSSSDFPDMEENGIYLTGRIPQQPQDAVNWYINGFYNLQDGSFEHYQQVAKRYPVWMIPNLK